MYNYIQVIQDLSLFYSAIQVRTTIKVKSACIICIRNQKNGDGRAQPFQKIPETFLL